MTELSNEAAAIAADLTAWSWLLTAATDDDRPEVLRAAAHLSADAVERLAKRLDPLELALRRSA